LLASHFGEGIPAGLFTSPVKPDDSAFRIQHHDQSAHGVEDGGDYVPLLLQSLLSALKVGNVEPNAMDEPGLAVGLANHLGFAMKPDHAAVARHHAIGGSQRVSRKK